MRKMARVKKTATLGLKIAPDLKSRLQAVAHAKERSLNWLATKYIEDGLEQDENERTQRGPNQAKNVRNDRRD